MSPAGYKGGFLPNSVFVVADLSELYDLANRIGVAALAIPKDKAVILSFLGRSFVTMMKWSLQREKASGLLEKSIRVISQDTDSVIIGPDAYHKDFVREGGRPHMPPFAPILNWVKYKGLIPTSPKISTSGNQDYQVALAKAVQWGIYQHGTSVWAARTYGTKGENPFPNRTIRLPEAQRVLMAAALRLEHGIYARIVTKRGYYSAYSGVNILST